MTAQQCIYKDFIYRLSLMLLNLYETNFHKSYKTERLFPVRQFRYFKYLQNHKTYLSTDTNMYKIE